MLIISSVAVLAFAGSPAQDRPLIWFENRTTQGCVFYKMIYDPGDAPITLPEYTWSGRCESGRPISGAGVLEKKYTYTSSMSVERETGTMVDGYWHGPVRSELFRSENGGPLKPESYSDGSWMPTRQSTYDMGCGEAWQERGECLRRPDRAAAEPPGQRIYDTPEEYAASQQRARSRLVGEAGPVALDNVHNTENDAVSCLELVSLNGAGSLRNNCTFTVEAVWCVENHDCNPGYTNMWSIGAGMTYPVNGSRGGGMVHWGACRGANSLTRDRDSGPFTYRCPDRLQNNR